MRIVVVVGGAEEDPWRLPASVVSDSTWIFGGERTMYEFAVAASRLGHDVELRGLISGKDLEELARWGGGSPRVGLEPRRPAEGELVVVPEGTTDPLFHARFALSPARAVMYVLAATGVFGPGILPGFAERPPLELEPEAVSLPDHYRSLRDTGFELWTNSSAICDDARRAGVDCAFTGTGQPIPFPEPGDRTHDAAYLADNRWMPLSRQAARRLRGSVLEIPRSLRPDVLREMASARILIHAPVVEGESRIQLEARAVGTIPVSLRSNRFVEGQEEGGGVLADSIDEMVSEIERLLSTPAELEERSRLAVTSAREQMSWERYVGRVDELLAATPPPDPRRPVRARLGEAVDGGFDKLRDLREDVAGLNRGVAWLRGRLEEQEGKSATLQEEIRWLRSVANDAEIEKAGAVERADALERRRAVRVADWARGLLRGRSRRGPPADPR